MSTPRRSQPTTPTTATRPTHLSSLAAQPSSPDTTTTTSLPSLPPPQTFDILPPLHALLYRLLTPLPNPLSPTHPIIPYPSRESLDIKELGAAASALKVRIQKARAAVGALPDVDRAVEEQEGEIGELERRVERLRNVLQGLGRRDEVKEEVDEDGIGG